ncbi:SCO-spondin [Liparis tanakae]|uniref:SCO-spondin n=1 Tax=Liparis tanakae TaxID=230148 RepID=A0A4Z2E7J0_9TELE|nr:SCO-spondin [Liparis tanakae]
MRAVCSGGRLDAVVRVVRLLRVLRPGGGGPEPGLHRPPPPEQRLCLRGAGPRGPGLRGSSLSGFVQSNHALIPSRSREGGVDDLCPWLPWSPCSRSCGAGSAWRRRACVCEEAGDAACPEDIEAERNREESRLCYLQPCAGCPMSEWSVWSRCSCASQRQLRYRVALSPATRGQQCTPVETQSGPCSLSQCDDCEAPFVYSACGAPCEKQCALQGDGALCGGVRECTPGCYCPQHEAPGRPPTAASVPQGATVTMGCSTW